MKFLRDFTRFDVVGFFFLSSVVETDFFYKSVVL